MIRLFQVVLIVAFVLSLASNILSEIDGETTAIFGESEIPANKEDDPAKFRNVMIHNWIAAFAPLLIFLFISYLSRALDRHNILLPHNDDAEN